MDKSLFKQAAEMTKEVCEKAGLGYGHILVVGCSSSAIQGYEIGRKPDPEAAEEVFLGINHAASSLGVYIAAQCCEHLNRALVVERKALQKPEIVNVIPKHYAGGSFAAAAYKYFIDPIVIEEIKADAGIDIGDTLIGMHLRPVAVPISLCNNKIGQAHVVAARTRPKYIGGVRAMYGRTKAVKDGKGWTI